MKKITFLLALIFMASLGYMGAQNFAPSNTTANIRAAAPAKSTVTKSTKEFPIGERIHKSKSNMRGLTFTPKNPLQTHKPLVSSKGNTAYGAFEYWIWAEFDVDDFEAWSEITYWDDDEIFAGTYLDGKYYAYGWDYDTEDLYYYIIDYTTGEMTSRILFEQAYIVTGLAYDYTTNTMYGLGYEGYGDWLDVTFTVDLTTGDISDIHYITGFTGDWPITFAIDLQGTAYVIDFKMNSSGTQATAPGKLYTMNKATGQCTSKGSTGRYVLGYEQSMAFDLTDGTLYWCEINDGVHHAGQCNWVKIDPATGATTVITEDTDAQVLGLTFVFSGILPCFPVTNAKVEFQSATSARISWDAVAGAIGYKVNEVTVEGTEYIAEGEYISGQTYTWNIVTVCADGESTPVEVSNIYVSVKDNVKTTFTLVPNPAHDKIQVTAATPFHTIEVVSFLGQTILSQTADGTIANLDVSTLTNGVYFVRIISENGVSVKKFVKQ